MSINPQLLLASLGQLGSNNNNSALANAILQAADSNRASNQNDPPPAAAATAAAVPPSAPAPASLNYLSTAQLQALLAGASATQSAAPRSKDTTSNNSSESKDIINHALASILMKQKLQESQQQAVNAAAVAAAFPSQAVGSFSVRPSASSVQASSSPPLQQILGKVVELNNSHLQQELPELQRHGTSASQPPSGTLLEQLKQLSQAPMPASRPQVLNAPSAASATASGGVQSLLAEVLEAAECQRQQKEREERILRFASDSGIMALLDQHKLKQQQEQQPAPPRNNQSLETLLGVLQPQLALLQAQKPQSQPSPSQPAQDQDLTMLANLLQQQRQAPASAAQVQAPQAFPSAAPSSQTDVLPAPAASANVVVPAVIAVPEKKRRRGRSGSFPQKIHQMLRDLEQQGRQDIASFVCNGTAFCIHRPKEFSKEIMPKYFKMGSYASFQRQLNLYDFTRIAEGPDRGSYFHVLFLQGKPLLSTTMKRKETKKPHTPKPAPAGAQQQTSH